MTAPTQVGALTGFAGAGTQTTTVDYPIGIATGDVCLLMMITKTSAVAATPAGWTVLQSTADEGSGGYALSRKLCSRTYTAGDTAPSATITDGFAFMLTYRGVTSIRTSASGAKQTGDPRTINHPSTGTAGVRTELRLVAGVHMDSTGGASAALAPPAGYTEIVDAAISATGPSMHYGIATKTVAIGGSEAADSTAVTISTDGSSGSNTAASLAVALVGSNDPPTAPTGLTPSGTTVDKAITQRLGWTHNDPNAPDTQSKFDLQWRLGAGSWNSVSSTTPNQFWDAAGSTFPSGAIEWQVRTYDALGAVGPWSASAFFTAATTPATPTITAPTNASTVPAAASLVWSTPSQDSYQVRKVADIAGSADTSTVYYDTGEVVTSTARDASLTFPTNSRDEHLQVRIKYQTFWSAWADVRVSVSYTPPLNPTLVALAVASPAIAAYAIAGATDGIRVTLTNPLGNLLTTNQASLETDTTGWAAGANTTISRSTAQAANGAASLALTSVAAGTISATTPTGTSGVPVVAGQVYTAVASFRAAVSARSTSAGLAWYTAAGALISTTTGATVTDSTSAFTQATVTGQAPATAAFAALVVTVAATGAALEVHYADTNGIFTDPNGNLAANPDFETDVAGWTVSAGTFVRDTAQANTGAASGLFTSAAAGNLVYQTIPTIIGQTYTVKFLIYGAAGGLWSAIMRDNTGAVIAGGSNVASTSAWTVLTVSGVATTTTSRFGIRANGIAAVNIDSIQVVPGTTVPAFVAPGYTWATPPSAVSYNDLWRRETATGGAGIRIARNLAANAVYTDVTTANRKQYQYKAIAVAANATTADSAWT